MVLVTLLVWAAGCGDVHFVPSPYTPQSVELTYSAQEDVTAVRWRVSAAPLTQTRFELLAGDGSYQPIDFAKSVFTGGLEDCGDHFGTCAQFVVRGHYQVAADAQPVQAVHDVYGVLPGGVPTTKTVPTTLQLKSFFHSHNDMVTLNITDDIASSGPYSFPRPYERTMWPTTGLCVSDTPPDDVSFSPLDATSSFPPVTPLTDTGTYCVAARPVPSDAGGAAMVQVRIATLPEIVTATQIFDPPVERSPIIYQIVLDLDIPIPDRCADIIQKIESEADAYLVGGSVPVHKLPTINLAANASSQCAQTNDRTVASTDMADTLKQLVTTQSGKHQQYHLLYFNNLDAPLPQPLVTSLQALFDDLSVSPPGYELKTLSWMFNPGAAYVSSLTWQFFWVWETADDMFKMALQDYGRRTLPYTTQFHDPTEPVALLTPDEVTQYEGSLVKICTSSPGITPIALMPFEHEITTPSWTITSADPPGYLVTLNNQVVVAANLFVEQSAIVNYQICTRYCTDHPFVTASGTGDLSWSTSYSCAGPDQ
jgi:hypothetical protein